MGAWLVLWSVLDDGMRQGIGHRAVIGLCVGTFAAIGHDGSQLVLVRVTEKRP
jgi:hypothetical protein